MKFINSTNCNNNSNCNTLNLENKSIIISQRFMRRDQQTSIAMKEFSQSKGFIFPYLTRTFITVKIKVNSPEFEKLTVHKKELLWLKLRNQLYWGCEIGRNTQSLCEVSKSMSILVIHINAITAHDKKEPFIRCSICFLNSTGIEIINWNRVSDHIKTLTFNIQQYLPHISSNELSNIYINVTRTDFLSQTKSIERIFITNISVVDLPKETPKLHCKFICGWGPQCLENLKSVCDGQMNCLQGEDEDDRLCSVFKRGGISFGKDVGSNKNSMDHRVMSTFKSYFFVIIFVIIFVIMIISFVCFYRSRDFDKHLQNTSSKFQSLITTQGSDATCNNCERKFRMNVVKKTYPGRCLIQLDDIAYCTHSEPVTVVSRQISMEGTQLYANAKSNQSLRDTRSNHKDDSSFKSREAPDTADWLNLFFHISSEARHKSLANHPPPNVNNNNGNHFGCSHTLSNTPSTCVFPVMI